MFGAKKKESSLDAQSRALYAPNTRFRNEYHLATESRKTTQNMSFRPKEVDWACSL